MFSAMVWDDGGATVTGKGNTRHLSAVEVDALREALTRAGVPVAASPVPQPVPWDVNTPLIVVGEGLGLFPGTAVRVCMHRRSLRHGREYVVADASDGRTWVPEAALSPGVDWTPVPVTPPMVAKREPWVPAAVKVGDRFRLLSTPGFSAEFGWTVGDVVEVTRAGAVVVDVKNLTATVSVATWATHNCGHHRLGERVA